MKPVCLPEKYEILGELGAGGMGQVYHARDRVLDREVALKGLSDQLSHELAGHIQGEGERIDFLKGCQRLGEGGGTTTLASLAAVPGDLTQPVGADFRTMPLETLKQPAFSLDEAETARVVGLLANRIGPVAQLARAIPDDDDRRSFAEAMGSIV